MRAAPATADFAVTRRHQLRAIRMMIAISCAFQAVGIAQATVMARRTPTSTRPSTIRVINTALALVEIARTRPCATCAALLVQITCAAYELS